MKTLKFILFAAVAIAAIFAPLTAEAGLPPVMGPFTPTVGAGTYQDTVFVPDLAYIIRGYDISGWWVTAVYTTDGGLPLNESCQILSTSGSWCLLDIASKEYLGFSTILTTGDKVTISSSRPVGTIERSLSATVSAALDSPVGKVFTITEYEQGATNQTDTLKIPGLVNYISLFAKSGATQNCPSQFYLRLVEPDDAADTTLNGMYRAIIQGYADSADIVVSPGFDATGSTMVLDAGDLVEVVPFSEINPNPQFLYRGYAYSGSATTAVFPDLIGRENAILADSYIKCITDQSANTDEGKMSLVSAFDPLTGTVTFTTGILNTAINDFMEITWTPAGEILGGANGMPTAPTPANYAANVNMMEVLAQTQDFVDSIRSEMASTTGIATHPTGVFHANGVSIAEDLAWVQDSLRKVAALLDDRNFSQWDTLIIDFSVAGWNTEVAHTMFTVTGNVEFEITGYCSTDCAGADTISFMDADTTASIIAVLASELDAGEALFPPWYFNGAQTRGLVAAYAITAAEQIYSTGSVWRGCAMKSADLGYKITDDPLSGGIIVVAWRWRPMTAGSTMTQALGAQMTL